MTSMQQSREALLEVVLLEADWALQPLQQLFLQRGLAHLFDGRVTVFDCACSDGCDPGIPLRGVTLVRA